MCYTTLRTKNGKGTYIMAHEVEMIDGVAQMAFVGDTPWHGLGTQVHNDLSPLQMMQKAGLDWNVKKVDAFINVGDEQIKTGQQALVRSSDNSILTNVGKGWNPVQNEQAFEFFAEYVAAGDMEMHTAGSLKGGQQVWALAKIKESFDVFGDDTVESYLLFSNPHQYGKSINVRFTPVRVVCNNTLTMSLESKADRAVAVGHRTEFNPDMVKEQLGIAHEKFAKYKEMAQFLGSRKFKVEDLLNYYNNVFPHTHTPNKVSEVNTKEEMSRTAQLCLDNLETQPGAQYGEGSWWQAFNSVTYVTDHLQGRNAENRLHTSGLDRTNSVK